MQRVSNVQVQASSSVRFTPLQVSNSVKRYAVTRYPRLSQDLTCNRRRSGGQSNFGRRDCYFVAGSIRDEASGTEYPTVQRFWAGEDCRSLGASVRSKSFFLFNVNVYSLTCYVEAAKAAKELGVRYRGGFFETEQDFCDAIMDGAFVKAIQLTILRSNAGSQVADAIEEAIAPRMRMMQQSATLEEFAGFFRERSEAITKGTNVLLLVTPTGTLNVAIRQRADPEQITGEVDWLGGVPDKVIESPGLCRALLEVWLGENSVTPGAKPVFAAGARALLESENIRRDSRKGGSG
eukprot:CAMPEP_0177600390 /NCGR_PEP_ID=MMETSP0419_2-20121207/13595_1 /TAXON_ID=582737 /ORGANISM="Tetraselmis sp., Strain GSL018" /LENGTH=292 /DNA_ID=CAMNT_0019093375 /DNA_START=77 /DNA_END=955 /DNA_ORIENTATION=-